MLSSPLAREKKEIRIQLSRKDSFVTVAIEDRGIGIKTKDVPYIFKEFYRVDDSLTASVRRSGLGLTISQRIVEDHDGTLTYKPAQPQGSIFIITLPIIDR